MTRKTIPPQSSDYTFLGSEKSENYRFRIDNAATGFSLISSKKIPVVYRLSVDFKEEVNIQILQKAIEKVLPRFPYFRTSIRKGIIWGSWVTNLSLPEIQEEPRFTNQYIPLGKNNLLYRIIVKNHRFSIECHHALTDGTGSMMFFRSIIVSYLQLKYKLKKNWGEIFHPEDEIDPLEYEDSFAKNYIKGLKQKPPKNKKWSFNIPIKGEKPGVFFVSKSTVSVDEIRKKAKEFNVSISVFLTAVYLDSLKEIQERFVKNRKKIKHIRINVSVDLRRLLQSRTMRIFSLLTTPSINPKDEQLDFRK
ncbi:MAG: hypothetical protein ACTSQF_12895, partial [Candidatus Heimdallarchaeaceae archaeon]